jgi:glycosyltransferase involved in cell wall biosynthesis
MKFSIVIVTFNRKKELQLCLDSISSQKIDFPFEVIVVYNGESSYTDKTQSKSLKIENIMISSSTPAHARNIGITKATGEYIFFLDDDCILPKNYFQQINFSSDWDILGGPDRTPNGALPLQVLIGQVLSSPFCMGFTIKRHSSTSKQANNHATERDLILCNLWFKRNIFTDEGHKFEESLFRNEENFLLKQLKIKNKKITYVPGLYVFHSRKNDLKKLATSVVKSGECRVQNFFKLPEKSELIYFSPLLFSYFFLHLIFNPGLIMLRLFLTYTVCVFIFGIVKFKTFHPAFICLHFFILFCYSLGLGLAIISESLRRLADFLQIRD